MKNILEGFVSFGMAIGFAFLVLIVIYNVILPEPEPTDFTSDEIESAVNEYRASKGLTALKNYDKLCEIADYRALHLGGEEFSHNGFRSIINSDALWGVCKECTRFGENLANNQPNVPTLMSAWESSKTHNELLLDNYTHQCARRNGQVVVLILGVVKQ